MVESRILRSLVLSFLLLVVMMSSFVNLQPAHAMTRSTYASQGGTGKLKPFIDTWDNIHLFQNFDGHIAEPEQVAHRYDFVWGAGRDSLAAWRAGNPAIFLTYYIPYGRDGGVFPNVTNRHKLTWWQAHYPDWILYRCDRKTPAYKFDEPGVVPLDFANPAVIRWQLQSYALPASHAGYDGIAADNVDFANWYGACGVFHHGRWVQLYSGRSDDGRWDNAMLYWLGTMRTALHALSHPLALIPNIFLAYSQSDGAFLHQVADRIDAFVEERGFSNNGAGYLSQSDWLQHVSMITYLQARGIPYFSNNQFNHLGSQQIQWALSSYLLCKYHAEAVAISGYQRYGGVDLYQEYNAQIGSPTSEIYYHQRVYFRDYSHGIVIVNPADSQTLVLFTHGQHYTDLYGHQMSGSVTLQAHTGIILLS